MVRLFLCEKRIKVCKYLTKSGQHKEEGCEGNKYPKKSLWCVFCVRCHCPSAKKLKMERHSTVENVKLKMTFSCNTNFLQSSQPYASKSLTIHNSDHIINECV